MSASLLALTETEHGRRLGHWHEIPLSARAGTAAALRLAAHRVHTSVQGSVLDALRPLYTPYLPSPVLESLCDTFRVLDHMLTPSEPVIPDDVPSWRDGLAMLSTPTAADHRTPVPLARWCATLAALGDAVPVRQQRTLIVDTQGLHCLADLIALDIGLHAGRLTDIAPLLQPRTTQGESWWTLHGMLAEWTPILHAALPPIPATLTNMAHSLQRYATTLWRQPGGPHIRPVPGPPMPTA